MLGIYRSWLRVATRRCTPGSTSLTVSSRASLSSFAVKFDHYGDPTRIVHGDRSQIDIKSVTGNKVLLRMLAAPINPADINVIQGVYPMKPTSFPAVGGNEGLAEILEVGPEVKSLEAGDWVIPAIPLFGTWRTHAVCDEHELLSVPRDISPLALATMAVNPCTAYRMLKDFEDLEPGDVVIQNGANSGCGQAVIQIADQMDIQTINIIRDRPNLHELVDTLKNLGATHVFTDEAIKKQEVRDLLKSMKKPKLALNCVGGRNAAELLKYLDTRGTMVTYGGMSKQPLMVPAGPMIFQDVKLKGYWMTRWNSENRDNPERIKMIKYLCSMIKKGNLKEPLCNLTLITDYKDAIIEATKPFISQKQILVMDDSLLDLGPRP